MLKNKILVYTLLAFIVGIIFGGSYIYNFGLNLPFRDTALKSSAQGEDGSVIRTGTRCSYTSSSGQTRYGRIEIRPFIGDVCQSSTGWSRTYR